jgi:hypothetical protein
MKVLITGATGLIGQKLTKLCHQKGWAVNYLSTSKNKLQDKKGYKGFYWDPKNGEIDDLALKGVDAIFHLVGASIAERWTSSYKKEIVYSRVNTTKLLFEAIKKGNYPIKKIVSASAIGIYPTSFTNYYNEDFKEVNPSFLGEVVNKWEHEVDAFSSLDIDVVKLRIGIVLSEKAGALTKMMQPIKYGVGSVFGNGKQWQSWIHIDDLADMFIFVMEKDISGVVNGVAPNPVTNEELTKAIAKQVKSPLILPNIPKAVLSLILGEMHIILFESQRVCSKKIEKLGFAFKYPNLKPALEDLL